MNPRFQNKNHVHKYQLKPYGKKGSKVYACVLPDCSHHQIQKELLIGKRSLCHQCDEPFILTADLISREYVRPRCPDCREVKRLGGPKKKVAPNEQGVDEALEILRQKLNIF